MVYTTVYVFQLDKFVSQISLVD